MTVRDVFGRLILATVNSKEFTELFHRIYGDSRLRELQALSDSEKIIAAGCWGLDIPCYGERPIEDLVGEVAHDTVIWALLIGYDKGVKGIVETMGSWMKLLEDVVAGRNVVISTSPPRRYTVDGCLMRIDFCSTAIRTYELVVKQLQGT